MATKADFTEDEWKTLEKGVTGAGLYVSASDPGFMDTFGEANALAKELAPSTPRATTSSFASSRALTARASASLLRRPISENDTLRGAQLVDRDPHREGSADADAYRELVLDVANKVAGAKHGVSDAETAAIEKIKTALGAPAAAPAAADAAPAEPASEPSTPSA